MSAPSTGGIRFNHATLASVTAIAVNAQTADSGNPNVLARLVARDDSTTTADKGHILYRVGTSTWAEYKVTALTDNTTWVQFTVEHVGSAGSISNGNTLIDSFSRTGDKGTDGASSGDALVANPLSQFAATTSAQLAGVISDETGTGALVFADTPTLVTPVIGAATGTSLAASSFLVSGHTTTLAAVLGAGTAITPQVQAHATGAGGSFLAARFENAATGPAYVLAKSRAGSVGSYTVVQSGDVLGELVFAGADGTDFEPAASIRSEVDGTPGAGDMPGRLVFATAADGAEVVTDRLILDSAGILKPNANDGVALGTGSLAYADLFLASGGVINWNNGDVTATHSANSLAFAGASSGYTFDALATITSASASALTVGANGATNPVLKVDASAASAATGISITAAAASSRAALAVISSGTDEGLSIDAKGSGTIRLGATSTGAVEFSRSAVPTASDGAALGTTSLMWSDLFLASGSVINFNNGDVTLTHSANALAIAGGVTALDAASTVGGSVIKTVGKETVFIPAAAMTSRTTNGAAAGTTELTTNDVMLSSLDFDQTTEEGAGFFIAMPKSWNESTVTFKPFWTAASGSGGVVWGLAAYAFSDDDALDTAVSGQQTSTDTLIATGDMHIGPESSAITIGGTPAEGDMVYFEITREVANGSDTLSGDAKLLGVHVYITTNASTDA